jgi:DNA helicase-2/ATP-dependent DNA helicase PcrA
MAQMRNVIYRAGKLGVPDQALDSDTQDKFAMKPEQILQGLDEDQREVVTSVKGPVCVMAGAGTGKTRAITHRIAYAIATGVTDSAKTLALTFTARAAGEMRARLRTLEIPNAAARTFHSAALKQLMYFWPYSLGGSFPTLLIMKSGLIGEAILRSNLALAPQASVLRDIASEIEWAKVLEVSPSDYVERALGAGRIVRFLATVNSAVKSDKSNSENLEKIAKIYQAYETLKHQERTVDFEDVLLLTVGMLEEDRDVKERVRDQYRFFTVDEYQDVSPLQQRLLNLWLGNREDICVVGDAAQTIYSFAGASSAFLLSFPKRFPDAKVIRLSRGYRSTPEILHTANAVLRHGNPNPENLLELSSMNPHGVKPAVTGYGATNDEIQNVVTQIQQVISTDFKSGKSENQKTPEVAILARTNSQLVGFEQELKRRKIETQLKSSERFFERTDVRDAMKVIRSASVLPTEEVDWYEDLGSVLKPFGESDFVVAFRRLAAEMKSDGANSLRTFLRELEERADQNNPPVLAGVVLATLHSAKGLEWDHVFLVGINEGVLPMGNDLDEERRLFYVGLTRAKRQVHLSYFGSPSPFLKALSPI